MRNRVKILIEADHIPHNASGHTNMECSGMFTNENIQFLGKFPAVQLVFISATQPGLYVPLYSEANVTTYGEEIGDSNNSPASVQRTDKSNIRNGIIV